MINLLYGPYGSGKTTSVINSIKSDTDQGIHTFLIVPEQEAVQAERQTLFSLSGKAQLHLEVLSFSRLYNRVCREYGGLSYHYITKPLRTLMMWQNLRELEPLLRQYKDISSKDTSVSDIMISAISEFKACGITPNDLEKASKSISAEDPLSGKLYDLALIYSSFDAMVSESYSDSADDMSRLAISLSEHDFFNGCNVYIDSFTSFTSVEHRVIKEILKSASNVTITIPLPTPKHSDISTAGIEESLKRIKKNAEVFGKYKETILCGNRHAVSPMISYLSENLWRINTSDLNSAALCDGSIVAEICQSPYAEANAAANHALELLRRGERARDIAVLMRDTEKYRGIIEPAFEKNGIPFYFSQKTDLCSTPPVKLLLSALRIKQYNWRKSDVISHIKTGLCDFSVHNADLFEEYINTWNINGSGFTGNDWTMNPDGFTDQLTGRGINILEAANTVRKQLTGPLEKLFVLLDSAESIPDMCRALYEYMQDIHLEDKLTELANKEAKNQHLKNSQETSSLYGVILNAIAGIANALPYAEATTDEFMTALKIVFDKTEVGTIPTSADEVVIGSAATMRTSNPKYVMLLGLCEGEFPASINDSGLLNASDRSTLSALGLDLLSDADTRSSDELMYVHRAMSAPSHKLFVFTSKAELNGKSREPSLPFLRLLKLFPDLKAHNYSDSDLLYLTPSPRNAASQLRILEGTSQGKALVNALDSYLPQAASLSQAATSEPNCQISPEATKNIFGTKLTFSATRFESFVKCPFNYYCSYVLGLREKKTASFQANIIGTFIHHIMEELITQAVPKSENEQIMDDRNLIEAVSRSVNEYIEKIYPQELGNSKKLAHLYERLKKLALLMIKNIVEEFSHSQFRPAFFELTANGKNGNPSPLVFDINGSTTVSFSGIIDRVDIFKHEERVYIRVVDYKTGSKHFSLDDVDRGINTQMLLYLFTLCRSNSTEFRSLIGAESDDGLIPAGAVYLSANIPVIEAESYENEETVYAMAEKKLKRSGIILSENDIPLAMNNQLSTDFLVSGIRKNKDGSISGEGMVTGEEFENIFNKMKSTILKISDEVIGGKADAEPLELDGELPCRFCHMKPICRKEEC